MERMEKEKVKRGVFLGAALQNHHMGHVEYSPFLCILRSHTLNAHYTAFICGGGASSQRAQRLRTDYDLPAYACMEHL